MILGDFLNPGALPSRRFRRLEGLEGWTSWSDAGAFRELLQSLNLILHLYGGAAPSRAALSSLGFLGVPWDPPGSPGIPWDPLGSPGVPWGPLGCPGLPWGPLGSLGFPRVPLGVPWVPLWCHWNSAFERRHWNGAFQSRSLTRTAAITCAKPPTFKQAVARTFVR